MIDYERPCDMYLPADPARLEDFHVFNKKWTSYYPYNDYYTGQTYDHYQEPEVEASTGVYHDLLSPRTYVTRDDWKYKFVSTWSEEETASWFIETARSLGLSEFELPLHNLRLGGIVLRGLNREQMVELFSHPAVDPHSSRRSGEVFFDRLQQRLADEMPKEGAVRYPDGAQYRHEPPDSTVLDLDSLDHRKRLYEYTDEMPLQGTCDSTDEEYQALSDATSPDLSYGSDASKSGDESDVQKHSHVKRPPGRPKGSGKKAPKRTKSLSVIEFLIRCLHDPTICPSLIKFEDYSKGTFRFMKPDAIAKLWGKYKQNDGMTFEKFSRAMRYHYKPKALLPVTSQRLVYQFGPKSPDFSIDNPNFSNLKTEYHMGHEK